MHPNHSVKAPNYRTAVLQQLQLTILFYYLNVLSTLLHCENQLSQEIKREREWLVSGSAVRLSIASLISLHSKQDFYLYQHPSLYFLIYRKHFYIYTC